MKAIKKGKSILDHKLAVGDILLVQWSIVPRLMTLKIINHNLTPYFFSTNDEEIPPEIVDLEEVDVTESFDCDVLKLLTHFGKQEGRKLEILFPLGGHDFQCYRAVYSHECSS